MVYTLQGPPLGEVPLIPSNEGATWTVSSEGQRRCLFTLQCIPVPITGPGREKLIKNLLTDKHPSVDDGETKCGTYMPMEYYSASKSKETLNTCYNLDGP